MFSSGMPERIRVGTAYDLVLRLVFGALRLLKPRGEAVRQICRLASLSALLVRKFV